MVQQGQVFPLKTGRDGSWAYRYRLGGGDSRRVQRGGFASEQAAAEALKRALEQLRRRAGTDRRAAVAVDDVTRKATASTASNLDMG